MIDKGRLQLFFIIVLLNRQEVKIIWIFGYFLRQVTLCGRKGILKLLIAFPCLS